MSKQTDLKQNVLRPLRLAALGVAIFIAFATVWSLTAKLSTTVHVSGHLVSSTPHYEIQHPYGGQIKAVHVQQHDTVQKQQTLIELDVQSQTQHLVKLRDQIALLENEVEIIEKILHSNLSLNALDNVSSSPARGLYASKLAQLSENSANAINTAQNLTVQIASRETALHMLQDRTAKARARMNSIATLVDKGVLTKTIKDDHTDRVMDLSSQLSEAAAQLTSLRDQLRQTRLKKTQYETELNLDLRQRLLANAQRLPELKRQEIQLQDEISNAQISSPISGVVMELNFATNQMQIPKGASLAVISRPLEHPFVNLTIPTQSIDQVSLGMRGTLTLSSLPQRNMSRVHAEISAISPDVTKDETGQVIGYQATAKINIDELTQAVQALHLNLHLSSGMPVALALEGREITFSQYLVAPFFQMFNGALQD